MSARSSSISPVLSVHAILHKEFAINFHFLTTNAPFLATRELINSVRRIVETTFSSKKNTHCEISVKQDGILLDSRGGAAAEQGALVLLILFESFFHLGCGVLLIEIGYSWVGGE